MKLATVLTLATLHVPGALALAEVSTGLDLARFSPAVLSRDPRTLCLTWVASSNSRFEAVASFPEPPARTAPKSPCTSPACLFSGSAGTPRGTTPGATLDLILESQSAAAAEVDATRTLSQRP